MDKIKICSLFSGIGGFEHGFAKAFGHDNIEVLLSSEIERNAVQAYGTFFKDTNVGDITKVNEKDVPEHDVLVGGFPCQSFSIAGNMRGFLDTRGTLFFDIVRIAKEKQPRVLVLENVPGLLSHDQGKTISVIVQTLSEIGYAVDLKLLNSKDFGIPQNRERVFLIAIRNHKSEKWDLSESANSRENRVKMKLQQNPNITSFNFQLESSESRAVTMFDVIEHNPTVITKLSDAENNAVIGALKDWHISKKLVRIDDKRGGNAIHSWDLGLKGKLTVKEKGFLNKMILERRKGAKDANPILPETVGATRHDFDKLVKLGYLKNIGDRYDFKGGNLSFTISKIIPFDGISPTLTRTDANRFSVIVKEEEPDSAKRYRFNRLDPSSKYYIRKITPLEALRIQGFPDECYTRFKEADIKDTEIYKMAGNAVTVNVIEQIALSLKGHL